MATSPIKFYRGTSAYYKTVESTAGMVYFNTETKQLLMGGAAYGLSVADAEVLQNSVKGVSVTDGVMTVTFNSGATAEIKLLEVIPTATAASDGLMSKEHVAALNSATAKGFKIAEITGDELAALGSNVKEAYQLVDQAGNVVADSKVVKVYKDSSLKEVYLGAADDTVDTATGVVTKGTADTQSLNYVYQKSDGTYELVKIDVSKFLAESEFGDGFDVTDGVVSVNVAEATAANTDMLVATGKNFLELEADGDGNKALAVRSVDTDSTVLQKDIVVAGLSGQFGAGNYSNNNVIPAGTDIYTILQNILCKELYASPTSTDGTITASIAAPSVTLDHTGTVEVGTLVKMTAATSSESTVSTTPNKVTGMEYGYSAADDDQVDSSDKSIEKSWTTQATGGNYTMSATVTGFNADTVTNKQTTPATVNARSMNETTLGCVAEGSNKIKVSVTGDTFTGSVDGIDSVYHCSNLGNTDATKTTTAVSAKTNAVSNAPTNSKEITVTGVYKYFLGYSDNTVYSQFNSASVRALTTKSGNITKDGTTTIVGATAIKSNGKSIVIACPDKYKLATINNGVGADILANFSSVGKVSVACGSISVDYNVYVYPITNGAEVEFKNVTLTKA